MNGKTVFRENSPIMEEHSRETALLVLRLHPKSQSPMDTERMLPLAEGKLA